MAFPSTDGTWKAPAMAATAIVHIVHDHVHYRPVETSGGLERLLERYSRFLASVNYDKISPGHTIG